MRRNNAEYLFIFFSLSVRSVWSLQQIPNVYLSVCMCECVCRDEQVCASAGAKFILAEDMIEPKKRFHVSTNEKQRFCARWIQAEKQQKQPSLLA